MYGHCCSIGCMYIVQGKHKLIRLYTCEHIVVVIYTISIVVMLLHTATCYVILEGINYNIDDTEHLILLIILDRC